MLLELAPGPTPQCQSEHLTTGLSSSSLFALGLAWVVHGEVRLKPARPPREVGKQELGLGGR